MASKQIISLSTMIRLIFLLLYSFIVGLILKIKIKNLPEMNVCKEQLKFKSRSMVLDCQLMHVVLAHQQYWLLVEQCCFTIRTWLASRSNVSIVMYALSSSVLVYQSTERKPYLSICIKFGIGAPRLDNNCSDHFVLFMS